ncbi:MAG TPA: tRNA guanosine(34) transglycosylase Tgt [Gemmatimonadales bacterium]|jgi:queuine tRNA-ribosyltransferase
MFEFDTIATDGPARAGRWHLPHGDVDTPCFMPVGTTGSVKGLTPGDLEASGAHIILGNTYHLHLRPGEATVAKLGGLHRFMAWPRPILTDSGGFQVFSLEGMRKVSEEGVTFRSHIDGSEHFLTPETAVDIQWTLGSDVAMAFDHVIPGQSARPEAQDALERTLRWLKRCRLQHESNGRRSTVDGRQQTLVPIIQGGIHKDLRREALRGILATGDWHALAVGGLSVGEPKAEMRAVLEDLHSVLPREIPRYLMGVGFPADLVLSIGLGMDLADCVAPTRMGRHGTAFTDDGQLNMGGARWKEDDAPLDADCDCETCRTFSKGYIRHLFQAGELLGLRLLALHNVRYLIRLVARARAAITEGRFSAWSADWLGRYTTRELS